ELEKLRDEKEYTIETCNALIASAQSYVALYNDHGGRFPLLGIDTKLSRVRWRAEVWSLNRNDVGGFVWHEVDLAQNGEIVAVFGSSGSSCYMEAFRIKSGSPAFRFRVKMVD